MFIGNSRLASAVQGRGGRIINNVATVKFSVSTYSYSKQGFTFMMDIEYGWSPCSMIVTQYITIDIGGSPIFYYIMRIENAHWHLGCYGNQPPPTGQSAPPICSKLN